MWAAVLGIAGASVALAVLHQTLERGEARKPEKPGALPEPGPDFKRAADGKWKAPLWESVSAAEALNKAKKVFRKQRAHPGSRVISCASNNGGGSSSDNAAPVVIDHSIRIKIMLAESSGKLDLSDCGLDAVPEAVFQLKGLEELSLAGNNLSHLPGEVGRLTSLSLLQLAGNRLEQLPAEVGSLASLRGLWVHGNRLRALPDSLGALRQLTQLSLSGNALRELPPSLGGLAALEELGLGGNHLAALPSGLGQLSRLRKLSLHGNQLRELPPSLGALAALEELWLQGNPQLSFLPTELGTLRALRQLSAADCGLCSVPSSLGLLPMLQSLSLYGCALRQLSPTLLQAPQLKQLWLEGNPLAPEAVTSLLGALPSHPTARVGLDQLQLAAAPPKLLRAAAGQLLAGVVEGSGPGYFKLERAPGSAPEASSNGATATPASEVLIVSFGSAPGVPNWGGLLKRVRKAAVAPQESQFDVLYVVDPCREWYGAGDTAGFQAYESRLATATAPYRHVVMLGDSMGATGALLFAHLASEVHAFTPQVDLHHSSIRPARDDAWFAALRERVLAGVAGCSGEVVIHTGVWRHDLDQARQLPAERVQMRIYNVESHRLAAYLDRRGQLLQIVRSAVLHSLGLQNPENVRLANLY